MRPLARRVAQVTLLLRASVTRAPLEQLAVVLACSLFFVGIAPRLRKPKLRMVIIGLVSLLCAAALVAPIILPVV